MNLIRAIHVLLLLVAVADAAPPTDAERERERVRVAIEIARARAKETVPAVATGDPYGIPSYDLFYAKVMQGVSGVLVVGIEDRFIYSYTLHCRVASGFGGLADGNWSCRKVNGQAVLEPWKEPGQKAIPFLPGTIIPAMPARTVDAPSTPLLATTGTERTATFAPLVARRGGISAGCTSYG